jgi:DNA-directed RNA polymerase specialized sigma24 family protein
MTKRSTQSDEADLIAGLLNRDRESVSVLYDRYASPLLGLICSIVKDDKTAHDLLKTSFLYASLHITDLSQTRQRLFPWLINIARQQALPYYKPDQAATSTIGTILLKPTSPQSLTEQIIEQQYVFGKSQQQVADALQIPLADVRRQTRLGLMRS